MDRQKFLEQVRHLREAGMSQRGIAAELGVHRGRVERALKTLANGSNTGSAIEARLAGAFVGRLRQMDELRAALDDANSGRARIVMLSGEAGIGKTRIAQEITHVASDSSAQVL